MKICKNAEYEVNYSGSVSFSVLFLTRSVPSNQNVATYWSVNFLAIIQFGKHEEMPKQISRSFGMEEQLYAELNDQDVDQRNIRSFPN